MGALKKYFSDFAILKETHKAYWGIQTINILDATYEFAFSLIITLFLSKTIGFTDQEAGFAIMTVGIISSITFLFIGPFVDRLGLRKALWTSLLGMLFFRTILVGCAFYPGIPYRGLVTMAMIFLAGVPAAMLGTVYQIGNRRFTSKKAQAAGFNVWYIAMNIGALLAGLLVDFLQGGLMLSREWVLVFGIGSTIITIFVALFTVTTNEQYRASDEESLPEKPKVEKTKKGWREGVDYAKSVIIAPSFLRMISALTLLLGVRVAFLYTNLLMPKYWIRVIGENAHIGWLNAINPTIIIIGVFLLVPIINKYDTYKMLAWGALLAALCFAPLAVPWYFVSSNIVVAYYVMAVGCMIILSFGEMMWSPRMSHYIVSVAPEGQEGTYAAFSSLPWFVGKTLAGGLSGVMLAKWCPEFIVRDGIHVPIQQALVNHSLSYWQTPEAMWLVLGLIAVIGPIIMLFLKDWFTVGMKKETQLEE